MSEQPSPLAPEIVLTANEVSGYRTCMSKEDSIQKGLAPISENVRNRIRAPEELSVFSNSEFAYAIAPDAIAWFWGKGGR